MIKKTKIYVARDLSMVGSAIVRKFKSLGCNNILTRSCYESRLS